MEVGKREKNFKRVRCVPGQATLVNLFKKELSSAVLTLSLAWESADWSKSEAKSDKDKEITSLMSCSGR